MASEVIFLKNSFAQSKEDMQTTNKMPPKARRYFFTRLKPKRTLRRTVLLKGDIKRTSRRNMLLKAKGLKHWLINSKASCNACMPVSDVQ